MRFFFGAVGLALGFVVVFAGSFLVFALAFTFGFDFCGFGAG